MIESIFADPSYSASKMMLDASVEKHEAIAANIANVDTPGYKRVDVSQSFTDSFDQHLAAGDMTGTAAPSIAQDPTALSQRQDGNNVQLDHELMAMSENTLQYDTLTEFVSGSLKQLQMAITGRSA